MTEKKKIQKATDEQLVDMLAHDLSVSSMDVLNEIQDRKAKKAKK